MLASGYYLTSDRKRSFQRSPVAGSYDVVVALRFSDSRASVLRIDALPLCQPRGEVSWAHVPSVSCWIWKILASAFITPFVSQKRPFWLLLALF